MNATGEGDQDKWYASIGVHRKRHLKPRLTRIYGALAEGIGKKAPDLEFNPLSTKDAKAVAETNKLEAEEADILITASVVTPEEVRLARAQGKGLFEMVDLAKEEAERVKTLAIPDNPEPEEEETDKGEGANGTGGVMPAITTATDNAEITLVHEARKSLGLPPFTGPWAKYNNNTVAEFRTRRQTEVEAELLQQFPPTVVPVPTAPNTPEAPKEPAK